MVRARGLERSRSRSAGCDRSASEFGARVEAALRGELASWADGPRRRLSLIILLDQFPRNIYRGRARAFAGDEQALALALSGMQSGADAALDPVERIFFYMPLQHSESVGRAGRVGRRLPAPARRGTAGAARDLRGDAQVRRAASRRSSAASGASRIAIAMLHRASTPEETEYLREARRLRAELARLAAHATPACMQRSSARSASFELAPRLKQLHRERRTADVHARDRGSGAPRCAARISSRAGSCHSCGCSAARRDEAELGELDRRPPTSIWLARHTCVTEIHSPSASSCVSACCSSMSQLPKLRARIERQARGASARRTRAPWASRPAAARWTAADTHRPAVRPAVRARAAAASVRHASFSGMRICTGPAERRHRHRSRRAPPPRERSAESP